MLKIKWMDTKQNKRNRWSGPGYIVCTQGKIVETYTKKTGQVDGALVVHPALVILVMNGAVKGKAKLEYLRQIVGDIRCWRYLVMKRLTQDRSSWSIISNQSGNWWYRERDFTIELKIHVHVYGVDRCTSKVCTLT